MRLISLPRLSALALASCLATVPLISLAKERVMLDPSMITGSNPKADPKALVDEQDAIQGDLPGSTPTTGWKVPGGKDSFPAHAVIDLGKERLLQSVWIFDTNGSGQLVIASGSPANWKEEATYETKPYKRWVEIPLTTKTRYLRLTRNDGGSNFDEIAIYEQTEAEFAANKAKVEADKKAAADKAAAESKANADREAGRAKAQKEVADRKTFDHELFGKVSVVDEIDVAAADPGHLFADDPNGATEIQTILGKPCRVLKKTPGEAAYMAFRMGQYKLLKPGAAYVLEIEYPEDAPRNWIINNSGNESSLGFATGEALGDAFRPKYVNNLNESVKYPLSGKYQTWTQLFHLHDRFPNLKYVRGNAGNRDLTVDDGFNVTIAQFSAENLPVAEGAAVSKIRLLEVADESKIAAKYNLPEGLPQRHLYWREEMADGVLGAEKNGTPAGLNNPLDWFKFKAGQMAFLGMNTYTKDLLEFGAVQHWDSSPHGGDTWAYYNRQQAGLWSQIVEMMGKKGYSILPYYEYSGSKGREGLGPQRRAKPLGRDDAYTHIKWIESANADITDPDTVEDFKKMLDVTIVREKDKARFVGAWIRPRSQMPIGFGDTTRKRFADEANGGREVTRQQLKEDKTLYEKYVTWWQGKRRDFFISMRDYLRKNGIDDATILYTAYAGEPGVGFKGPPVMVVDDVSGWKQRFESSDNERERTIEPITVKDVVKKDLYTLGLKSPPANWGGWELQHANPVPDPEHYKDTDGVLMTMAFNRLYTAASPKPFDAFRGPAGLALERHYSLNENMIFNKNDKEKLGYFAVDIERNGPYCMAAEALAMANGDPNYIGYLVGRTYSRGFPQYVRNFNTAFLSLPALPSQRLDNAASDDAVVVRTIKTPKNGTYLAIVNTAMTGKDKVTVKLPATGKLTDAATGETVPVSGGKVTLDLYPFQLRALHVMP